MFGDKNISPFLNTVKLSLNDRHVVMNTNMKPIYDKSIFNFQQVDKLHRQ